MTVKRLSSSSHVACHSSGILSNTQIRKQYRRLRQNLPPTTLRTHSKQLFKQIISLNLPLLDSNIASYFAINGEMDNQPLHCYLFSHNQPVFLPIISNDQLIFGATDNTTPLISKQFNLLEPRVNTTIKLNQIDIIFIPLTAFKKNAHRLGMGGGFYDKTIAACQQKQRPLLIGIAHDFQHHTGFTTHDWDIQMDMIVTEKRIYFKKSA